MDGYFIEENKIVVVTPYESDESRENKNGKTDFYINFPEGAPQRLELLSLWIDFLKVIDYLNDEVVKALVKVITSNY